MREVSLTIMVVHLGGKHGEGRGNEDDQTAATKGMATWQSILQQEVRELSMHLASDRYIHDYRVDSVRCG